MASWFFKSECFVVSTSRSCDEAKSLGVATWKTKSQPATAASKLPSSVRSAPKILSSPKGCSARRCGIFFRLSASKKKLKKKVKRGKKKKPLVA